MLIRQKNVFARVCVCVCSCLYSLCCFKGHLKVLPAIARAEGGVVKGLREEVVHQSAEGHPITPAGGEVLNIYVLRQEMGGGEGGRGVISYSVITCVLAALGSETQLDMTPS